MKEVISKLKQKVDGRIRLFTRKHTSFKNTFAGLEIGNVLVAVSTTLLMALGSLPFSFPVLISLAALLIVLGVVGKYIDEVSDDYERMILYEEHLNEFFQWLHADENSISPDTDSVSNERIQLSNNKDKECTDGGNGSRDNRG